MVRAMRGHEIVLTHGDLVTPRNILVRDAKIMAVLDWENVGLLSGRLGVMSRHSICRIGMNIGFGKGWLVGS